MNKNEALVRQFVRNRVADILLEFAGIKVDPQEVIDKINSDIINEFVEIAKKEVDEFLKDLSKAIKNENRSRQ